VCELTLATLHEYHRVEAKIAQHREERGAALSPLPVALVRRVCPEHEENRQGLAQQLTVGEVGAEVRI